MIVIDKTVVSMRAALLGACTSLALCGPAYAQDSEELGAESNENVIVVTAQKREQDLQDVPISMSVVSGETLSDMGVQDFTQLDQYVPNFYVQATPGNNSFYIRGIGSEPGNLAFEQTVGLFVDGIYGGHARQFQAPFLDVERVEVLRGPQGALVGKNTSAGAISVVSAKPTNYFTAEAEASYEFELNGLRTYGMVSGPVSDVVSARLAVQYDDTGGYIENLTLGGEDEVARESFFARGSLLIDTGGPADLLIKVEGGSVDLVGTNVERILTADDPDLERSTTGFPGFVDKDFDNTDTLNFSATANFEIGDHTLTSITGYSSYNFEKRLDSDFGPAPAFASLFAEDFSQLSQEIRLASPVGGFIEYIAGGYAHINDYELTQSTVVAFGPYKGGSERLFDQENTVLSLFGSATLNFTDALRVIGSLRWTYDKKTADQTRSKTGVVFPTWLATDLTGRVVDKEWDPSVTVQYDVTPDVMIYATYGQGSKAGGFVAAQTTTTQAQFAILPESAETWEAGVKAIFMDGAARFNAAVYRTEISNLQVSSFDAVANGFITTNAGSAKSQGVEADGSIEVAPGISLNSSIAYLDAEYGTFIGAPCPYTNPTCNVATNDANGQPLPRSPKWSGTLGFNVEQPISGDIDFIAGGVMSFRSSVFLDQTYNPVASQESYQKFDLRAGIRASDKSWEIALVGKNLTNEITASHAFATPLAAGVTSKYIQPPRTIAVQGRVKF